MVFVAEITTVSTYTILVNQSEEVRNTNVAVVLKSLGDTVRTIHIGTIDCEGPAMAIQQVRLGHWHYEEWTKIGGITENGN